MTHGTLDSPEELHTIAGFLKGSILIDLAHEAAEKAALCYDIEQHRDMGVFGTIQYSALVNAMCEAIRDGSLDMRIVPKSVKHAFERSGYIIRPHRVRPQTLVPYNAKTAKKAARKVSGLGPTLFGDEPSLGRNLILGLVATPERRLSRIILGELVRVKERDEWGYQYNPVEVFSASGGGPGDGATQTPPEDVMPPVLTRTPSTPNTKTGTHDD